MLQFDGGNCKLGHCHALRRVSFEVEERVNRTLFRLRL
jgi:hypothetical protein